MRYDVFLLLSCLLHPTIAQIDDDEGEPEIDPDEDMVAFKGGLRIMGYNGKQFSDSGEHPHRFGKVNNFKIDRYPVTNAQFARFVKATHYTRTEADVKTYSLVFLGHYTKAAKLQPRTNVESPWWRRVYGARWDMPYGFHSDVSGRERYPVVHVSISDAASYCEWVGKRLPTEDEWEYAARLNDKGWRYPWGDYFEFGRMNVWQGFFPIEDTALDGYAGISPVDAFYAQNTRGMYDMVGNVWEWTSTEFLGAHDGVKRFWEGIYTLKGGSFVDCPEGEAEGWIRSSVRTGRAESYTAENVGFRCAQDDLTTVKPIIHRYEDTIAYKREMIALNERFRKLRMKNDAIKAKLERKARERMERIRKQREL